MGLIRLSNQRPDNEIQQAIQKAVNMAKQEWGQLNYEGEYAKSGFGITILRPKDLNVASGSTVTGTAQGSVGWYYSIATASTWTTMIEVDTEDDLYLIIEGVMSRMASPSVLQVKFTVNGEELPIINIEEMYTWDLARAYLSKPFIVKPKSNFKFEAIGSKASTAELFGLLGHIIAKRSRLIKK